MILSSINGLDLGSEIRDPEIFTPDPDPDPGVKKASDPRSGSAILKKRRSKNCE